MKKQERMKMELAQLVGLIEHIAPPVAKRNGSASLDESGILDENLVVDVGKLAVCVFPTRDVAERTLEEGIYFLISHYRPSKETRDYMMAKGVNCYVAHLSRDVAVNGNV